ncbi:GNAT family N-acetyltransferase [Pseudoalteromonas fenneropenaei]|uniref:GNAT family N-acetyltransferase n=1 Tax=Pseudoalteromonas fenneropenaei TaxID=1737459 RepID=A0ABV7CG59_9GAMM
MFNELMLRDALPSDAKVISKLILPLTEKYVVPDCLPEGQIQLRNAMSEAAVAGYIAVGMDYQLLFSAAKELVGVVAMKDNRHLYHLFVAESYHGQGLAGKLWQVAKARCMANGNTGNFTVNSALSAEPVYLKFGFQRVAGIRERAGIRDIPMQLNINR